VSPEKQGRPLRAERNAAEIQPNEIQPKTELKKKDENRKSIREEANAFRKN